jgi:hypothetical protein
MIYSQVLTLYVEIQVVDFVLEFTTYVYISVTPHAYNILIALKVKPNQYCTIRIVFTELFIIHKVEKCLIIYLSIHPPTHPLDPIQF